MWNLMTEFSGTCGNRPCVPEIVRTYAYYLIHILVDATQY